MVEELYRVLAMHAPALDDRGYRALAHTDRRRLLRLIRDGERSVTDLVADTELGQPIVSQHLRVLREADLVTVRVDGNRRLYSVRFDRVADLRAELDGFWSKKLDRLKSVAQAQAGPAS